jgi:hypothetical protein
MVGELFNGHAGIVTAPSAPPGPGQPVGAGTVPSLSDSSYGMGRSPPPSTQSAR